MRGQWLGRAHGNSEGTILIDVDEDGGLFLGTVIAQPDNLALPIVFARFAIPNSLPQKVTINIFCLNPQTYDIATWDQVKHFFSDDVTFATTADVTFDVVADQLKINWSTVNGDGDAYIARSKASQPSELHGMNVKSWSDFKAYIDGIEPHKFVFRGQQSSRWRLRTSFHRAGRANMERYAAVDIPVVAKHLSAQTSHLFDLSHNIQYGAFMSLIQHHGYPTPLLDWTHSPYVAAFFAYRGVRPKKWPANKVRIFQFSIYDWNKLRQNPKLSPIPPHVSLLDAIAFGNPRMLPQQGLSTVTNVDDIETYIRAMEGVRGEIFLQAIDLPESERPKVMADLEMMGITAGSLLPGLDGACEQLRERYFPLE